MTYQPIKRGMTEAVTRAELKKAEREGRPPVPNVKQLTWFDTIEKGVCCVYGVIEGLIYSWYEDGRFSTRGESDCDIYAPPRYEWQWIKISPTGMYYAATAHYQTAEEAAAGIPGGWRVERIEGSKRLVKG